jgi:6-phosphofructokinase 1
MIRRIAVLMGDNDAPGMNGVLRALTRSSLDRGWEVRGICEGYAGLMDGAFIPLSARSVDGIIQQAGTLLESFDWKQFATEAGQKHALARLAEHNIDALVVVGGAESQEGAFTLSKRGFPVIGIAASVENDLAGFDISLGVDTALNIAVESIDQARASTADYDAFFVEVAGRRCGYLAVASAIASGAAAVVIPERDTTSDDVETAVRMAHEYGESAPVIIVAEGAACHLEPLSRHFIQRDPLGRKRGCAYLGHLQRRSAPGGFDRLLGMRLGASTVDVLAHGEYGVLVGPLHSIVGSIPMAEVIGNIREIEPDLMQLAEVVSPKTRVQATNGKH